MVYFNYYLFLQTIIIFLVGGLPFVNLSLSILSILDRQW